MQYLHKTGRCGEECVKRSSVEFGSEGLNELNGLKKLKGRKGDRVEPRKTAMLSAIACIWYLVAPWSSPG
jgi:hypothetical protein